MAAYIQLISNETGEPVTFVEIDERMCKDFKAEVDAKRYFRNWYDMICFPLALGQSYQEIRERWIEYMDGEGPEIIECTKKDLEVLQWLEARYEPNAWLGR